MITGHRVGALPADHLTPDSTGTCYGDIDLIAVERAMNGQPVKLTVAEMLHAARLLSARGLDDAEVGRRLRQGRHAIGEWRRRNWAPPQAPRRTRSPESIDIGNAKHGRSGYMKGCGCQVCRDACAAYNLARKRRRAASADSNTAA
ncbi:hypothetical protein [Streptomyces sp. NPDC096033]|uniref:hypothetical protein n=1 Tax=Streptomyces sp. NPDC096033 TaxID=3366071 RepID=UPI00380573CD